MRDTRKQATWSFSKLLASFLTLGVSPIVGAFPFQLVNGTTADATQVMADFNFLAAQVNNNAQPVASVAALTPVYVSAVGGTPNAITLTPTTPISSYFAGQQYSFLPISPNTGATTIATSGLAVRNLVYADGTAMTGGELLTGQPYIIEDNGSAYVLINSAQATGIVSWTPTITFGGGSTGITYSTQSGKACKVGRIVMFSFTVTLSAKGSSTGTAQVNGLPYTINAGWSGNNAGPVVASNLGIGGSGYCVFGYVLGGTGLTLNLITNNAPFAVFSDVSFGNTTLLAGAGVYAA